MKRQREVPSTPSTDLALERARFRSRRSTKPTRNGDSCDSTTGNPLCSVSLSKLSTSSTVIESCVTTQRGSVCLKNLISVIPVMDLQFSLITVAASRALRASYARIHPLSQGMDTH